MRQATPFLLTLLLATTPTAVRADAQRTVVDHMDHLPPVLEWSGASTALMLDAGHAWATDFEKSGGTDSPSYDATVAYLQRLAQAAPEIELVSLGKSPEGRDIWCAIASGEGAFTAEAVARSARPTVFSHSGIHSGEIDGKDAGLMLLRDMTVLARERALLDRVNFVFVPIFSVDGHERRTAYSRMNQHGPTLQGWRTTARNLNLNRDFTKADAPEMRHMLRALEAFDPDIYLDLHVTDGADYQYDITYGANGTHGWSPNINSWLAGPYKDAVDAALTGMGHIPGPLTFTVDRADIRKGMYAWTAGPRFSNGYGDARHMATILVENHSLKPYRQRVLGTYVLLEATLRFVADDAEALRAATAADRSARPDQVHLAFGSSPEPLGTIEFKAIREHTTISEITGRPVTQYAAEPFTVEIPVLGNAEQTSVVTRPRAYWIPAAWGHLREWLDLHGIAYDVIDAPRTVRVERTRLPEASVADDVYEGHVRVNVGEVTRETANVKYGVGAIRVDTDQDLGTLATILLEAESPDGLLQWGFMHEVLQRTEYFEDYVMEPMARQMMEDSPELAAEFMDKLATDAEFAGSARARLDFFYERTPYYDRRYRVYPIGRQMP